MPGIYAAGDIVDYHGKVKLIATGFGEVATAVNNAFAYLNPGKSAFPGHLSDYAPRPGRPASVSSFEVRPPDEDRGRSIVGVGIDVVPVERFAESLRRTPSLAGRLFTAAELVTAHRVRRARPSRWRPGSRRRRRWPSRSARGGGMLWTDAEVLRR